MKDLIQFATDYVQEEPVPLVRHVLFIAEVGINHNGDLENAKKLIDMAKQCGCDVVKFQKRTVNIVYTKDVLDSPRESPWGATQRAQKEALEFGQREYDEIDAYCKRAGIDWMASAWDVPSQHFLRRYDLKYNKVASAMLGHHKLLGEIAAEGKPTFISTGMSTYEDIDKALEVFHGRGCPFILLHSVSEYPAPEHALNLRTIVELRRRYRCPVGYSGHESTVIPSLVAVMMGAVAVERHITLDRSMYGSDQAASLEKRGLEMLVGYSRTIPVVIGDGAKRVTEGEAKVGQKLRYYLQPLYGDSAQK